MKRYRVLCTMLPNHTWLIIMQTRMPFSRRRTIRIQHRSQKHLQMDRKLISLHLTLILCNLELDLQMTLTFLASIMAYEHTELTGRSRYVSFLFDLDLYLDPMTLILKFDLNIVKMYLYAKNEVPSFTSSKVIP